MKSSFIAPETVSVGGVRSSIGRHSSVYSVAFGWPTDASVNHTVLWSGSGQYHTLPAPVTSYCHCWSSLLPSWRSESRPLRGCCRLSTRRGSVRNRCQHSLVRPGSMAPQLLPTVGGVTGGKHHVPLPAGRWGSDPLTSTWGRPVRRRHCAVTRLPNGFLIGLVSRSASSGSAKIAAVSRHCVK